MIFDVERIKTDEAFRADCQRRFEKDAFYAAAVIGYKDLTPVAHQPAVDLYPIVNRDVSIGDVSEVKNYLHLDPRHSLKTSLKRVKRLQWICAFPEEITILNQSATQKLAKEIAVKTARHFYQRKGSAPTVFQAIYPHLVTYIDPDAPWDTGPRSLAGSGIGDMESTLDFTSPESTQSGWHPWHVDNDDVEDTKNSGIRADPEVRQRVIDTCEQNENLLRDNGYIFTGGTRYHPLDYYGKNLRLAQLTPDNWAVLVRASLTLKDGNRLMPGEFPDEDDMIIHFPQFQRLRYKKLREAFYQNYESFMCQQQNDPLGGSTPKFDKKLMDSCRVEEDRIPMAFSGETFCIWRPAYSGKKDMERYCEGVAGRVVNDKIYILDAWQGVYAPTSFAKKIVDEHRRWQSDGVIIINTPGSDHVQTHVRNEAARRNTSLRFMWGDYVDDDVDRFATMENLEPLLKVGRVLFSSTMRRQIECEEQFVLFGQTRENGIIECISRLADRIPLSSLRANMEEEELEHYRRSRDNAFIQQHLNMQGMPTVDEELQAKAKAQIQAMQETTTYRMPPLPGGLDG